MATAKASDWRQRISSHEAFVHDSIDGLGYDWSRVADPNQDPRFPLRIYLPQTTEDVVTVVTEAKRLGTPLTVRAHGHSSNDLVVTEGSVLLTEKLDKVLEVDARGLTVTVQAGAASAAVDEVLATHGLGLKVIGDHAHVTTGGFASVGGISASSFRHGLFVDVLERFEYVTWDGEVLWCSRTENADRFYQVLLGLGRYGVITTLVIGVERVDKHATLWRNRQTHYRSVDDFLGAAGRLLGHPPADVKFLRGMWMDGGKVQVGQFSEYVDTPNVPLARLQNDVAYGFLHGLGYVSGKLPARIDRALKYLGVLGIMYSPPYATQRNAESFSDKILDATVGEPTRYLVAIARQRQLDEVCRRLLQLLQRYRDEHGCFTVITLYLKGIRSEYLSQGDPEDEQWVEVLFYVAISPGKLPDTLLDRLVGEFDEICVDTGSYRYMHSKTSNNPQIRSRIDPNTAYTRDGRRQSPVREEVS
jgi:hypothetical protein